MISNFLLDDDANQKLYALIESVGMLFWEAAKTQIIQELEDKYGNVESLKFIIEDIKKV